MTYLHQSPLFGLTGTPRASGQPVRQEEGLQVSTHTPPRGKATVPHSADADHSPLGALCVPTDCDSGSICFRR